MKINQRSEHSSPLVFQSMVSGDGSQLAALFQINPDNGRFASNLQDQYQSLLTQQLNTDFR